MNRRTYAILGVAIALSVLCLGTIYNPPAAVATAWGAITGTLSSQSDLQTALNAKGPAPSDVAYNATTWDAVTTIPPSKNATRDILETIIANVTTAQSTADTKQSAAQVQALIDASIQDFDLKDPVRAATTGALPFSPSYNNGSSGVGATLTGAVGILAFDGYTPALNDRLLVKNQAAPAQNGIYKLTTVGTVVVGYVLTREPDFNQSANIIYGDSVGVLNGTANANQQFTMNNQAAITVGTTAITFAQTSGGSQLTSGAGILITGNSVAVAPNHGVIGNASFDATDGSSIQTLYVNGAIFSLDTPTAVVYTSTGRYEIAFAAQQPDVHYYIFVTLSDNNRIYAIPDAAKTIDGFSLQVVKRSDGTFADDIVTLSVVRLSQ